jgi:hypothetical protein
MATQREIRSKHPSRDTDSIGLIQAISVLNIAIFPLLLKPAAQKERMDWNSSTRSSRLCVAPVVVLVMLWSLSLFRSAESRHSL